MSVCKMRSIVRVVVATIAIAASSQVALAQMPKQPKNLQVLPKTLSTDSVFTVMLGVADALGITCGNCHPGGDNATWDSTNFSGDVTPIKATAREMFRLVNRLNSELLPPMLDFGSLSTRFYTAVLAPIASPANASLLYAVFYTSLMFALAYAMYGRRWFVKL